MNWVDITILGIIALSVAVSLMRGFTREALSLAGWIIAFWVALTFADRLEGLLISYVEVPSIRLILAFAILFLATLILVALVNYLVGQLVRKTGLSGTDRMIGIFFGLARGIAIVTVLVLLGGLTPLPGDPWWREAALLPYFQEMAVWVRGHLPAELASNIRY